MNKKYTPVTVADVLSDLLAGKTPKKGDYAVRDTESDMWHAETILTSIEFSPGLTQPFITKSGCRWRYCARITVEYPIAEGFNPHSLTTDKVGEGFRLLTVEEIERCAIPSEVVEFWSAGRVIAEGWTTRAIIDDPLTRKNIYRTTKPAGYFLPKSPIAKGHHPQSLTEEQVGVQDGWRLLMADEIYALHASDRRVVTGADYWCPGRSNGPWMTNPSFFVPPLGDTTVYRTRNPEGFYPPKVPKYVPWTFETAPKGHVLTRFGGTASTCWRLIVSWAETTVGLHEYPREVCTYKELLEKAEYSLDGGKTWSPAGTEVKA